MRIGSSIALTVASLTILAIPAYGQDDAMEFQRCIWRCLANSNGADDPAYQQCITNICDGGDPDYSPPPDGRWGYGHHPVLGLSAHINIGDHAIGFSCLENDGGYAVSHRITRGLLPGQTEQLGVATLFLDPFQIAGATTFSSTDAGYDEQKHDYCLSGIDNYRRSQAVMLMGVEEMSLTADESGQVSMEISQDGRPVTLRSEDDINQISRSLTVPLSGSSAAIRQLINQCGSLSYQISLGCNH